MDTEDTLAIVGTACSESQYNLNRGHAPKLKSAVIQGID